MDSITPAPEATNLPQSVEDASQVSSKKPIIFGILGLILVVSGFLIYSFVFGENRPPALALKGGLQGFTTNLRTGFLEYDASDVSEYKTPEGLTKSAFPAKNGVIYLYSDSDVKVKDILEKYIVPQDGMAAMVGYWSSAKNIFVTSKNTIAAWQGQILMLKDDQLESGDGVIPARTGFFIITNKSSMDIYGVSSPSRAPAQSFDVVESGNVGWNLVSVTKAEYEKLNNVTPVSIWKYSGGDFVRDEAIDSSKLDNYLVWLEYSEKPSEIEARVKAEMEAKAKVEADAKAKAEEEAKIAAAEKAKANSQSEAVATAEADKAADNADEANAKAEEAKKVLEEALANAENASAEAKIEAQKAQEEANAQAEADAKKLAGWYDKAWSYRKSVTIDSLHIYEDLDNFPVLIKISGDNNLIAFAKNDGSDILFTTKDDSKVKLPHEIESYDGMKGDLVVWVNVPKLSFDSGAELYMYYGNEKNPDSEDYTDVWGDNYAMVQHMNGNFYDSTKNKNNGTEKGKVAISPDGKISAAADFVKDSTPNYISVANNGSLNVTDAITLSAWINTTSVGDSYPGIISKRNHYDSPNGQYKSGYTLFLNSGNQFRKLGQTIQSQDVSVPSVLLSNLYVNDGEWHLVTTTYDTSSIKIYIDGNLEAEQSLSGKIQMHIEPLFIGQIQYEGSNTHVTYQYSGLLDEVRVSPKVMTGNWIRTEFENQNLPGNFSSVGEQEGF
ncbi:hypothetical protein COY05_00110 [Candidatus Peregrinibacteria bacterium CG_4_10_14_0_2_um_filter_38_24]|nr:MAG: hypothetical protein COY05_00110 [Candidatus Peregrinibacteria bacterium CG_4_10_14_0_2_um_filter_38_24]